MMMKRSHHMPMFTTMDATHMMGMEVRHFLNQKMLGVMTLQAIISQYTPA